MKTDSLGDFLARRAGALARRLVWRWTPRPLVRAAVERGELLEGLRRPLARGQGCQCPVCRSELDRFRPAGDPPRAQAACPVCGARERHRLAWLFLERASDLFDGRPKRLLHLAPERCFVPRLRRLPGLRYVSADLDCPWAELRADITSLPFSAGQFDALLCSHVLEHVEDDRQALAELLRVLAPGGWAMLAVPLSPGPTRADPAATTPEARRRLHGHPGHVRRCGEDYGQRIAAAGFQVRTVRARELLAPELLARAGVAPGACLFHARKP
ncbi:MAG TPA: methyltransferase domain-containing protein [Myxococcota bacterium]|nr:methyltransferase domain-containing protein [Myxococcota bacterium]HRY92437.1 methyltransferase domain-containing protein [Myxococcota bacterium]HSA22985.1 methyltransferase domain-containing protein [Myxococcota bacterium]